MGWFRRHVSPAPQAAWEGPFAPPAPTGRATFNPMVRTAAELTAPPVESAPQVASAPPAAAASSSAAA